MKNTSLLLLSLLSYNAHATLQKSPELPNFILQKMAPETQQRLSEKNIRQQVAPYYVYPRVNNPLCVDANIEIAPFDQTGILNLRKENEKMVITYKSVEPSFMFTDTIAEENAKELFEYLQNVINKNHIDLYQKTFFTPGLQESLSESFLDGIKTLPDVTERDKAFNVDDATNIKWVDVTPTTREHEYRFLCGHLQATLYLPLGNNKHPTITWQSLDQYEKPDQRLLQPEADLTLNEMFMLLIILQKAAEHQQNGVLSAAQQDLYQQLQDAAQQETE